MSRWVVIRSAIAALGAFGAFSFQSKQFDPEPTLALLSLVVVGSSLGVLLVIGVQSLNPWSDVVWSRPSWRVNPFNLGQPLQFFHLASFHFLACGVASSALAIFNGTGGLTAHIPLAVGLGMFAGVWLSVQVYRHKLAVAPN